MTSISSEPYPYSPIVARPPLRFPEGARLAFYIGLNLERFRPELPVFSGQSGPVPDPLPYGWRDYGNRVGFWRLLELFDELNLPVTGIVNSDVCTSFPQIIEAGTDRDWAWVAHGQTNSEVVSDLSPEQECSYLDEMLGVLDDHLPARPIGWLGPALTETLQTPRLLAESGLSVRAGLVQRRSAFRAERARDAVCAVFARTQRLHAFHDGAGGDWARLRTHGARWVRTAHGRFGKHGSSDGPTAAHLRVRPTPSNKIPR